ncbi:hypothetical protein SRABI106_03447 [Rahnella aquatilis]|nr:hypothetical protein SRABI106_03447 [Rahnella aquatilis]
MVGIDGCLHVRKELLALSFPHCIGLAIEQSGQAEEPAGKHQVRKDIPHDRHIQQLTCRQGDPQQTGDIRRGEQVRHHIRHT